LKNVWQWIGFLAIGLIIGFMGSFLFFNDSSTETAQQRETTEPSSSNSENVDSNKAAEEEPANEGIETVASDNDDIFSQKGCVQCHSISPLNIKGNGTGPDFAIVNDDVQKRFGKTLEEFLDEPEGTMSAIFSASPLSAEEKQEVIRLIQEYSET
jgi:hypothetical protein